MSYPSETSDARVLELLAQRGPLGISELSGLNGVTPTAVRQRLVRLMQQGLVGREVARRGRGRPSHRYQLTDQARQQADRAASSTGVQGASVREAGVQGAGAQGAAAGNNFADLALTLWQEVRAIRDPEVRRGLFARLAESLARVYGPRVNGDSLDSRLEQVRDLFAERHVPIEIERHASGSQASGSQASGSQASGSQASGSRGRGPTLTVMDCPYPELAERDRGICAMEKMLFSQLLETPVRLSACRLNGHSCCQFETGPGADIVATLS